MTRSFFFTKLLLLVGFMGACQNAAQKAAEAARKDSISHEGMVYIKAQTFLMGASDAEGRVDEYPQHKVQLSDFWIDATEVTNAQFKKFVDATGYITTAEKKTRLELN